MFGIGPGEGLIGSIVVAFVGNTDARTQINRAVRNA
jgi:hypothetical protein